MYVHRSALLLALALPVAARAQSTDTLSLAGRSTIVFGVGLTGRREAGASYGRVNAHTSGELGSFAFNHWVRADVGITIAASILSADVGTVSGGAQTSAVTPILFGVTYSPRALALSASLRPFASLAAGPYIHSSAGATLGSASASSESVAGARFGVGTNWFVARHFALSLEGDYHLVGDVTGRPNASGFGMLLGFGVGWGGKY